MSGLGKNPKEFGVKEGVKVDKTAVDHERQHGLQEDKKNVTAQTKAELNELKDSPEMPQNPENPKAGDLEKAGNPSQKEVKNKVNLLRAKYEPDRIPDAIASNFNKLSELHKGTVKHILVDMEVLKRAYIDNIDATNFTQSLNKAAIDDIGMGAMARLKELKSLPYMNLNQSFSSYRSAMYLLRRDLRDNQPNFMIAGRMEDAIKAANAFLKEFVDSYDPSKNVKIANDVARGTVRKAVERGEEKDPVVASKSKVERATEKARVETSVAASKQGVNKSAGKASEVASRKNERVPVSKQLRNVMRNKVNSYSLASVDDMLRYKSKENKDRVLVKTALDEIAKTELGKALIKSLKLNVDEYAKISKENIVYIVSVYQKVKGLSVDGIFGKNTFNTLKKDAGGEVYISDGKKSEKVSTYKMSKEKSTLRAKRLKSRVSEARRKSDAWYEKEADLSISMFALLKEIPESGNISAQPLNELKNIILERFRHHDSDPIYFTKIVESEKSKILNALNQLDDKDKTDEIKSIIDALRGVKKSQGKAPAKKVETPTEKVKNTTSKKVEVSESLESINTVRELIDYMRTNKLSRRYEEDYNMLWNLRYDRGNPHELFSSLNIHDASWLSSFGKKDEFTKEGLLKAEKKLIEVYGKDNVVNQFENISSLLGTPEKEGFVYAGMHDGKTGRGGNSVLFVKRGAVEKKLVEDIKKKLLGDDVVKKAVSKEAPAEKAAPSKKEVLTETTAPVKKEAPAKKAETSTEKVAPQKAPEKRSSTLDTRNATYGPVPWAE